MECIVIWQQGLPTLILFCLLILFTCNNIGWVSINRYLYCFLVLSIFMIGGEFLPIWWKFGAQYYDLIYALGLSFLTGFFLYWLTVGREEMKKKEYYNFYSLLFLFDYYKLITHFYMRDKYKELIKENGKSGRLKIELPSDKVFNGLDESPNSIKKILNHYENDKIEIKKDGDFFIKQMEQIEKEKLKKTSETDSNKIKVRNYFENPYKIEDKFLVKIYKKICDKRKIFKAEFSTFLNMGSVEDIGEMKFILDYTADNLKGEPNQIEYFLKNHKHIRLRIKKIIEKNLSLLKKQKKYIPGISLELTNSNFGSLDSKIINSLINDFYSGIDKRYRIFNDTEKYEEYEITKIYERDDEFYMILSNNEERKLDVITNICMDKLGILFI